MAVTWKKVAYEDNVLTKALLTAKGGLISASAASTPVMLAVGTNNYVLTADSTTASGLKWAVGGGSALSIETYASDNVRNSNDAEKSLGAGITTYTKMKEIQISEDLAGVRIAYDMTVGQTGSAAYCYTRIYKNGVAIGTEHGKNDSNYTTYTEDFSNLVAGDLIQIYGKGWVSYPYYGYPVIRNMRLQYDMRFTATNTLT